MIGFFTEYADRIMPEPNSGCWLWIGAQITAGYGAFTKKRKVTYAHRAAYEAANGIGSAAGLVVRHRCDTPACVNPDHLEIGTYQDNSNDKYERGRGNTGERGGNARLTEAQVREILAMRKRGSTYPAIARHFGVHPNYPEMICRGIRWGRITKIQIEADRASSCELGSPIPEPRSHELAAPSAEGRPAAILRACRAFGTIGDSA